MFVATAHDCDESDDVGRERLPNLVSGMYYHNSRASAFAEQPRITVRTVDSHNENSYHQETGNTMHTQTEQSAKTLCGKGWARTLLLPVILALLPVFGALNAQPIDLCSYPNGIVLEIGGLEQIEVIVDANTTIDVILESDCTNTPSNPPANNGVYCTGDGSGYTTSVTWSTWSSSDRTGQLPMDMGDISIGSDDEVITNSLDACPGTEVRLVCI